MRARVVVGAVAVASMLLAAAAPAKPPGSNAPADVALQ
jgi:hypothetical protein